MKDAGKADKAALRREILALRRRTGRNSAYDARICARIAALSQWRDAQCVFLYLALSWEIGTDALFSLASAQGKCVCVPLCRADGQMDAVRVTRESALKKSALGVLEPDGGEILPPERLDLILVPALAFDRAGYRLGRGGGYYDRWLAASRGVKIGLCYSDFLYDALPRQAHDIPVDGIMTQEDLVWTEK